MLRNIVLADNARAYRVINIVVNVGNAVGKVDNAAFRRTRLAPAGMAALGYAADTKADKERTGKVVYVD